MSSSSQLFRNALAAFLLLLAPACRAPRSGPVRLERGAVFTLREPAAGPSFFATQQVTLTLAEGVEQVLLSTVENTPERLSLVASGPLGQTLFTVSLGQGSTHLEPRIPLPSWLDLRLLPALVQLANWPAAEVRRGLGPGLELEEEGNERRILKKRKLLLRLKGDGPPPCRNLEMEIPGRSLRVRIETLEEGAQN